MPAAAAGGAGARAAVQIAKEAGIGYAGVSNHRKTDAFRTLVG